MVPRMDGYCVLVAELARARVFTLESSEAPATEASPYLVERETLVNPQRTAAEADLWTDTRRGAHREHQAAQIAGRTTGIPHQNFDEHREENEREHNRKFVRDVATALKRVVSRHRISKVVLCAEKQALGSLRREIRNGLSGAVELDVVAKDLTGLSRHELHQRLAKEHLLPEQRRPPVYGYT